MLAQMILLASLAVMGDMPSQQWERISPLLIGSLQESEALIKRHAGKLNDVLSAQKVFDPQAIAGRSTKWCAIRTKSCRPSRLGS
jgi:hypothetical protein